MKILMKGAIFMLVELYFYSKTSPSDLELFFFGWGFIYIALFLYNSFSVTFEGSYMSTTGRSKGNIINVLNLHRENIKKSKSDRNCIKQTIGGISDRFNLLYLVLFLINVIFYILTMPR